MARASHRRAGEGTLGPVGLRGHRGARLSPDAPKILSTRALVGRRRASSAGDRRLTGASDVAKSARRGLACLRLALGLGLMTARTGGAQNYFGQNQVQYDRFDWQILETEHFQIYYYPEERKATWDAARMAERAYARLSRVLDHQFREKKPIML